MGRPPALVRVAAELRLFLKPAHRGGSIRVACDGTSSLGHVVQSLGVPLTEVGCLVVNGAAVTPGYRPAGGDVVEVAAVPRPQPVPVARFILDVHLGALARRLRLAGVDASYANDAGDDTLIEQANAERRILLTKDRGLLRRCTLWLGAYVRGAHPDTQLDDVLGRFTPPLAPWTRCTACNGPLQPAPKAEVEPLLQPGTRRTYQQFSRCQTCGRVYWRGAHSKRLQALISAAQHAVRTTSPNPRQLARNAAEADVNQVQSGSKARNHGGSLARGCRRSSGRPGYMRRYGARCPQAPHAPARWARIAPQILSLLPVPELDVAHKLRSPRAGQRLVAYLSLMAQPDADRGEELIETLTEREGIPKPELGA